MKHKRLLFLFSIFFMFFILVNSVYADWVLFAKEGYWEIEGRTHYKSGWQDDTCFLTYNITVANFTAYLVEINGKVETSATWVTTYWEELVILHSETTGEEWGLNCATWKDVGMNFFGIPWVGYGCEVWLWDGAKQDETVKIRGGSGFVVHWKIRVFKYQDNKLKLQAEGYNDKNNCILSAEKVIDVNPSFWESITIQLIHMEESQSIWFNLFDGQIEGWVTNEMILNNLGALNFNLTSEAEWKQQIADYLWQVLTGAFKPFEPVVSFFGNLWKYINYALQFLGNLFNTAVLFIPLLLEIFGIWILLFTLVNIGIGRVDTIVEMYFKIYQFFANLISMFVNVIEAIYNKIKFW